MRYGFALDGLLVGESMAPTTTSAARRVGLRSKARIASILRPRRKLDFLYRLPPRFEILDVGCGSNSPYLVKSHFPDCTYTGIDIADYRQSKPNLADHYLLVEPDQFPTGIRSLGNTFDAVISAHNLEHCNDRNDTLEAMMGALKRGGRLYLSFPSEASVNFPSRLGCLNYYDDPTHQSIPPNFGEIADRLRKNGFSILYSARQYQPPLFRAVGLLSESLSRRRGRRMEGTWEYYGFESIIWAQKQ